MGSHPMFEQLPVDMNNLEICEKVMREDTDEAQKVMRNKGKSPSANKMNLENLGEYEGTQIWHAVF